MEAIVTETKEKKAEVQIKTGKKTNGAESIPNSRIICYMGCSARFCIQDVPFVFSWSSTLFMERPLAMNLSKLEHLYVE